MRGFRRGRDGVLCNAAAKLFNGGGHPYAAGFKILDGTTIATLKERVDKAATKLLDDLNE